MRMLFLKGTLRFIIILTIENMV